ncbi:MAG: YbhB/YbcL family Raf kinase inhibitor-like protein [Actinobacteria bacterium]|nr:YbhB/YbcL family Raf kinase inhibitor-like protein [Actinomycetota bacterium]
MSTPPLPFAFFPPVATFTLESDDIAEGERLQAPQVSGIFGAGGEDRSPALRWSGAREGTKSYAVTMFDPDAPTGSGFWHWAVFDIPASVTSLPAGAGTPGSSDLPMGAVTLRNDAGMAGYLGSAPPEGREHRYVFTVHAVGVESLGLGEDASPAFLGFNLFANAIGRAEIVARYHR